MKKLTGNQKWMLTVMLMLAGNSNEFYAGMEKFQEWTELCEDTLKTLRKSLVELKIIYVSRVAAHKKHIYSFSESVIQSYITNFQWEEKPTTEVEKEESSGGEIQSSSGKNPPLSGSSSGKNPPHNKTTININNNESEVVFSKNVKFENKDHRNVEILEFLERLAVKKLIKGKAAERRVSDLLVDIIYHVDHRKPGLRELQALNSALKFLQNGTWTRPKGLREKLERESLGREQENERLKKESKKAEVKTYAKVFEQINKTLALSFKTN